MTENNNNIPLESLTGIEELWSVMNNIENYLNRIKAIRLLKAKVNELADICLLKMRMLYDSLNEFIFMEKHLWKLVQHLSNNLVVTILKNSNLRKNFLIIKCQNQAKPKV